MQILYPVKVRCIKNFPLDKYSLLGIIIILDAAGFTARVGYAAIISILLSHNDRRMAVIALLFSKPIICNRVPDTLGQASEGWTRDVPVIYHRQKPSELLIDLSQLHHN